MKLQHDEAQDRVHVTIPKEKARLLGWYDHLEEHGSGSVEVTFSAAGEGKLVVEEVARHALEDEEDEERD